MDKIILLLFLSNFLLVFLIAKHCKLSFFSLKIIVTNYILLPLLCQFLFNKSYGLLELNITELHYNIILLSLLLYNLTYFILLKKTKALQHEKEKLGQEYYIDNSKKYILILVAIACVIIAFPSLPFSYTGATRFQALLPGKAWNHIAIICLIFLFGNLKKDLSVKITYAFCIFWFLSHYERVDIVGLIMALGIVFLSKLVIQKKLTGRRILKFVLSGIAIFATMIYIGGTRSGDVTDINLLKNIVVQKTAADVAYTYNISIDYAEQNALLSGESYQRYLVEAIPLLSYDRSVPAILKERYYHPGGEYILSEPYMNFGIVGVPVFAIVEFSIISLLLKSKRKISLLYYIFILSTVFRTTWYGITYIETGIIYIVPLLYLFCNKNLIVKGPQHENSSR